MLNINFRSVRNKETETLNSILKHNPDIVIGTETWLNVNEASSIFLPDGYNYFRKDRDTRGGGVVIGVRKDIKSSSMDCGIVNPTAEIKLVEVNLSEKRSLYIMAAYRPEVNNTCFADIKEALNRNNITKTDQLIVGGDFNIPDYNWHEKTHKGHGVMWDDLQTMMDEFGLDQRVLQPTRKSAECESTLDLFFTNNGKATIEITKGISDHDIVKMVYDPGHLTRFSKESTKIVKQYHKVDIKSLLNNAICYFDIFETAATHRNVNENWIAFKDDLRTLIENHVPKTIVKLKRETKPWVKKRTMDLIERSRKAKRKQRRYFLLKRQGYLQNLDHQITKELIESKETFLKSLSIKKQKNIWKYVNKYRKDKDVIGDLKDKSQNKSCISDEEKGNLLNGTFREAFSKHSIDAPPFFAPPAQVEMPNIEITEEGIEKLILELDVSKSPGPDGVSARDLRMIAPVAAKYLQVIFTQTLNESNIPDDWRKANICPIFKKGDKSDPCNYRPISLTSIASKIMEHILVSNITKHLTEGNLLSNYQFGFRTGASTELLLVALMDKIMKHVQNGGQVDAIAIDLSRAFDKVSHQLLLLKLNKFGLGEKTVKWFQAFLSNRVQRVVINGTLSQEVEVSSGVPQGSVCGPLLFILYINDLIDSINSSKVYFADDGTIYKKIETKEDQLELNRELIRVQEWCVRWKMEVNWGKTHLINFTKKRQENVHNHVYTVEGITINKCKEIKMLGVTIRDDLKWTSHIDNICKKANSQIYLLTHLVRGTPEPVKLMIYKALVRPHLEYASSVWSPGEKGLNDQVEKTQRRAIRAITEIYDRGASVTEMRNALGLETLSDRRDRRRLINFYNIVNHNTIVDPKEHLQAMTYKGRRDHDLKFSREHCKNKFYADSFFPSMTKIWNELEPDTATCVNLKEFTKKINNKINPA